MMRAKLAETRAAYLFLLPFLVLLIIFFGYAAVRAIYFSFTNYDLFNTPELVGFKNYRDLFTDGNFLYALRNTVISSIIVTVVQTFLALVMATILNNRIRGIQFFRAAFYMPSITSSVVITLIFLWMFQQKGLINYIASGFQANLPIISVFLLVLVVLQIAQVLFERVRGLPAKWFDPALFVISLLIAVVGTWLLNTLGIVRGREVTPIEFVWLQTDAEFPSFMPFWLRAPIPLIAIMIQNIFTTIPTFMLMYLAGLQDVPKSHYEAASLDGATAVQQFRHITIPAVQPVTFLIVTLSLIGTLQMFDQVAIFGNAAPLRSIITLAYYVYNRMFPGAQTPEVGLAAAAALFLALFTLIVVLLQRFVIRSENR
jgi:multiple sugar transport system permease protein